MDGIKKWRNNTILLQMPLILTTSLSFLTLFITEMCMTSQPAWSTYQMIHMENDINMGWNTHWQLQGSQNLHEGSIKCWSQPSVRKGEHPGTISFTLLNGGQWQSNQETSSCAKRIDRWRSFSLSGTHTYIENNRQNCNNIRSIKLSANQSCKLTWLVWWPRTIYRLCQLLGGFGKSICFVWL